jgi:dolichyl-phosphate beta-glucosyltransferase
MNSKPYLSVIIPAFNEEKTLPQTLEAVNNYLKKQNYSFEIVVVNDGSQDKTASLVRELASKIENLRLIENKENQGKGAVVKQGMLNALGQYRLFMDADNSTTIDHLEKVWPKFQEGFEVVIGTRDSRDHKEAKQLIRQPFWKIFLGDVGNLIIQILLVPGIWDTQCGFKCFSEKAAKDLFSRSVVKRWSFDVEILALARKLGYKIALIPVTWVNKPASRVKLSSYFHFLWEVLNTKIRFLSGFYDKRNN